MNKMRILHVASFQGNVGDNANHNGLRSQLATVLPVETSYDELEIRRFYRKYDGKDCMRFDESFVELANTYDLIIIGGGNFFEIWIEESSTGCTIDITMQVLDKITTKILFYGLGFDTYKGSSESTREKFYSFLGRLLSSSQFMVTVRNDGSIEQLTECYGLGVAKKVFKVPDGGFFVRLDNPAMSLSNPKKRNIVLSIAEDMLSVRFSKLAAVTAFRLIVQTYSDYIKQMCEIHDDMHFIFMPHIYSDLHIMSEIVSDLPDYIRRSVVTVGPYVIGQGSENIVFSTYKEAYCVLSMRFHGNVVPIGLNVPTIGVSTYRKIYDLFRDLELMNLLVETGSDNFCDLLFKKTELIISSLDEVKKENYDCMQKLNKIMSKFLNQFDEFMNIDKKT